MSSCTQPTGRLASVHCLGLRFAITVTYWRRGARIARRQEEECAICFQTRRTPESAQVDPRPSRTRCPAGPIVSRFRGRLRESENGMSCEPDEAARCEYCRRPAARRYNSRDVSSTDAVSRRSPNRTPAAARRLRRARRRAPGPGAVFGRAGGRVARQLRRRSRRCGQPHRAAGLRRDDDSGRLLAAIEDCRRAAAVAVPDGAHRTGRSRRR